MDTDLQQAIKEVHKKTDINILEVKELNTKIAKLEVNQKTIYHIIDETKTELSGIKENQAVMGTGIMSITKTLNGNGLKGLCDLVTENAESAKKSFDMIATMSANCIAHSEKILLIDPLHNFIERFKGVLRVGRWLVPGTAITGIVATVLVMVVKNALR